MSPRRSAPRTRARRAVPSGSARARAFATETTRVRRNARTASRPTRAAGPTRAASPPRAGTPPRRSTLLPSRARARAPVEVVLARQPWSVLRAPLERAGVEVEGAIGRLKHYARLLLEWNRGVSNLMSGNDEQRF